MRDFRNGLGAKISERSAFRVELLIVFKKMESKSKNSGKKEDPKFDIFEFVLFFHVMIAKIMGKICFMKSVKNFGKNVV
jgi:hypothetical protein